MTSQWYERNRARKIAYQKAYYRRNRMERLVYQQTYNSWKRRPRAAPSAQPELVERSIAHCGMWHTLTVPFVCPVCRQTILEERPSGQQEFAVVPLSPSRRAHHP